MILFNVFDNYLEELIDLIECSNGNSNLLTTLE